MTDNLDSMILHYPVTTLTGEELLPKGTKISAAVLDRVIEAGLAASHPVAPIMEHGTVHQDIKHFLGIPPYNSIFSDPEQARYVINLFNAVSLPTPLFKILDYFKANDFHTYRHSLMVYALSTLLAKVLGADDEEINQESIAGPTHDFGKINVPIDILNKTTPLTNEDDKRIRHHVLAGYVLLCYYLKDRKNVTIKMARDHHERRDGSGYPRGIKQRIRLVEIVTVADIYDALIAKRPYRPAPYTNRTALDELYSMAEEGKIGWELTQALIGLNRQDKPNHQELIMSAEKRGEGPKENVYGLRIDDK